MMKNLKLMWTGWQGVNCPSIIQFTTNIKAHEFAKILINIRLINTESKEAYKLLYEILNNKNLTDKYIMMILRRKRVSEYENREIIINKLYEEDIDIEKKNKHIKDHISRQDPFNINKIDGEKRKNILQNLNKRRNKEHVFKRKDN